MTSARPETTDQVPWLSLLGVMVALSAFGLGQGLSYPLFSLMMQRQGIEPGLIGLSAAMMPLGLMVSAVLVPVVVRHVEGPRLGVICALLVALGFLAIYLLQNWIAWYVVRFLLGLVINPLYILGEVWALGLAPVARRGRIMGIFNTVMGAGYAGGPLTLTFLGSQGWPPFAAAITGFLICASVLLLLRNRLPSADGDEPDAASGVVSFARMAPALLLATGVSAAVQQSNYSLLPLFGAGYGLVEASAALLVTILSLGNIFLQMPLGLAAERFGARTMVITCAAIVAIGMALLPAVMDTNLKWPLLVILGGCGYGIHTMNLIELGSRFRGRSLVAGNAALALMWGVGGIAGPPTAGALLQVFGPVGLVASVSTACAALVAFSLFRLASRAKSRQ